MKTINKNIIICACIFALTLFGCCSLLLYKYTIIKLEKESMLTNQAINVKMVQVPVNICTEMHQELKWVTQLREEDGIFLEN